MGTSGISTGFPVLSRTSGQIAHVLRTRSPLGLHPSCPGMDPVRLACVKHAASVRPEPGSNSPSRSFRPVSGPMRSESRPFGALTPGADWHKNGCPFQCIDFCSLRVTTRDCPHWLLALSIPFSRSDSVQARATDEAEVPGHHLGRVTGTPALPPLATAGRIPSRLRRVNSAGTRPPGPRAACHYTETPPRRQTAFLVASRRPPGPPGPPRTLGERGPRAQCGHCCWCCQ